MIQHPEEQMGPQELELLSSCGAETLSASMGIFHCPREFNQNIFGVECSCVSSNVYDVVCTRTQKW